MGPELVIYTRIRVINDDIFTNFTAHDTLKSVHNGPVDSFSRMKTKEMHLVEKSLIEILASSAFQSPEGCEFILERIF